MVNKLERLKQIADSKQKARSGDSNSNRNRNSLHKTEEPSATPGHHIIPSEKDESQIAPNRDMYGRKEGGHRMVYQ